MKISDYPIIDSNWEDGSIKPVNVPRYKNNELRKLIEWLVVNNRDITNVIKTHTPALQTPEI